MQKAFSPLLTRNSLELPSYDFRNLSFEKALTRSKINGKELLRVLNVNQVNKKAAIRKSLIRAESNYNKEINLKLFKVGNILGKIPHPKMTINTFESIPLPLRISFKVNRIPKLKSTESTNAPGNDQDFDYYLHHFQQEIQSILSSNHHFVLNTYQFSQGIKRKKLRKLKTIYKYVSDAQTSFKFHFLQEDFRRRGLNDHTLISSEYKFIKLRDESFQVLDIFKRVITCIIDHFFMAYNNDQLFKKEHLESMNEYCLYLKETYEFYKKELKEIVKNYFILTKGLVNCDKIYSDYVNDLCKSSEGASKEEEIFLRTYNEMMKMETLLH